MRISDWSSDVCSSDLPIFASRWRIARPRLRSASSWLVVDQSATFPTAFTGAVTTVLTALTQPPRSSGRIDSAAIVVRILACPPDAGRPSHIADDLNRLLRWTEGRGLSFSHIAETID